MQIYYLFWHHKIPFVTTLVGFGRCSEFNVLENENEILHWK